jgi:hypothetical protein
MVRFGGAVPQVVLNRRRDVREGETARKIGPFEAKDAADVLPGA